MEQKVNCIELKVKNATNVGKLAASIKGFRDSKPEQEIILRYIGAGAGAQALKAVIIANRMLASIRQEYCMILPMFGESEENSTVMLCHLKFKKLSEK